MAPNFLIFGQLTREFLLPPSSPARLDVAGGSPLYVAAGFRVWELGLGLVGRVGNDYPREWLDECASRGFDTAGIKILDRAVEVREFRAYTETLEVSRVNPVSQFARREMTFPKSLLGIPNPPDLIEIQNIQFTDYAYQRTWEDFTEQAKKNPKWETMSKRQRLIAFSRNIVEKEQLRNLLKAHGGKPPVVA